MAVQCPNNYAAEGGASPHRFEFVDAENGVRPSGEPLYATHAVLFCANCGEFRRVIVPDQEVENEPS